MDKQGLQRITLKQLKTKLINTFIVGIVIRSRNVNKFTSKKDNETRGVWNLTLRDSVTDYINITCWGSVDFVCYLQEKFCVGDVVNVLNPKIDIRHIDSKNEQYSPSVTSPFTLTVNENQANIIQHDGDIYEYLPLLHYPTKPGTSYLTLGDIHHNGGTIRGDFVDLLVGIQAVYLTRKTTDKNGRLIQKRDIVVLDQTQICVRITLWEDEFIKRADNWRPRETILFMSDVRVDWSNFDRNNVALPNSKTVITEDPLIPEAEALRNYMRSIPSFPDSAAQHIYSFPDPDTITTVMTCKRVTDLIVKNKQFTALLYAFITHLDLDGFTELVHVRCERCNGFINNPLNTCVNLECPVGSGAEKGNPEPYLDIRVSLSDHTGSIDQCKLSGKFAEQTLAITVREFCELSSETKETLKWKYLLERCTVRIVVIPRENFAPIISIVKCELADMNEVAAKLPIY